MKQTTKPEFLYTQGSTNLVFCTRTTQQQTGPEHNTFMEQSVNFTYVELCVCTTADNISLSAIKKHAAISRGPILDVDINYAQTIPT